MNYYFIKDTLSDCISFSLLAFAKKEENPDYTVVSFADFENKYAEFWRNDENKKYTKVFFIGIDVAKFDYLDKKEHVFLCRKEHPLPEFKISKVICNDDNAGWIIATLGGKVEFQEGHKTLAIIAKNYQSYKDFSDETYSLNILYREKYKDRERIDYFFKTYGYSGYYGLTEDDNIFTINKESQINEFLSELEVYELRTKKYLFISTIANYNLEYVTLFLKQKYDTAHIIFIVNSKYKNIYLRRGDYSNVDVSVFAEGYLEGKGYPFAANGKFTKYWEEKLVPNFIPL